MLFYRGLSPSMILKINIFIIICNEKFYFMFKFREFFYMYFPRDLCGGLAIDSRLLGVAALGQAK